MGGVTKPSAKRHRAVTVCSRFAKDLGDDWGLGWVQVLADVEDRGAVG
jgi:hypothetical protein